MLVFPLDLKNVEEVCRSGVHLDEVLVGRRLGVGELGYFELMGPLDGLVLEFHCFSLCPCRLEENPGFAHTLT